MIPIRTAASNFVYRGPTPDIGDAWVERRGRHNVHMVWHPSEAERAAIAAGASIELGIYAEPIPPVSLNVTGLREITAAGIALRDRAVKAAPRVEPGVNGLLAGIRQTVPDPGHWLLSEDVWKALNAEHALDNGDGLPELLGRPLMVGTELPEDTLEYAVFLDGERVQ